MLTIQTGRGSVLAAMITIALAIGGCGTGSQPTASASTRQDRIQVFTPAPGSRVSSPLLVRGIARGSWYFEGQFPVQLEDSAGRVISRSVAIAEDSWMTDAFVPFSASLDFSSPAGNSQGTLVLQNDNPSGLPEHDAEMRIPLSFAKH